MAEFTLPKNSKIRKGKDVAAPAGATRTKKFKVYRYDPVSGDIPPTPGRGPSYDVVIAGGR